MCGIAGLVRLDEKASPASREEAFAMARRLTNRGPDALTTWVSPRGACALGHTRLRVIDLETGDQPMSDGEGRLHVVFNGEIYNFRELRRELEGAGHRFRTRSDTEVLLHAYMAWGDEAVERLDGMFAFAVWDEARGRLFLARDRAGKKPLFWVQTGERFAFASEIKALLALPWTSAEADGGALPYYLAYGYVPAPRTMYRGIRKLPPATWMTVDPASGSTDPRRYWSLDWQPTSHLSEEEAAARLRTLLGSAVERRLVADVSLGAFLSGGLDSTVVVGLMRERTAEPVRTFSLGFVDDSTYDESATARATAAHFGTRHTEFTVEADAVELVDELVEAYDEPFGDSSAIPTFIVSRLTRAHVTVALTGDGGDEMLAGYPRFLAFRAAERLPGWLSAAGAAGCRLLPHHADFRHPVRRARQFFEAAALPPADRVLRWLGFFDRPDRVLAGVDAPAPTRAELLRSLAGPLAGPGGSPLSRVLAMNFLTYLPEDLLVKMDRCSMAHGLELRSPFLDMAVMEFAAALPDSLRIRGTRQKWLLRRAFADLIPEHVARRPKMGFGVPLPLWFRTGWREMFEARVLSPTAPVWRWLRRSPVAEMWADHQSGRADHAHRLWALLTLAVWLERRAA